MADDLSLLFRLRADNQQAKAVIADTRAAVGQLRQSFGPQLNQSVTVTNKAFSDLGDNLQNFVAQRVPLVGGAIVRVTEGLRGAGSEGSKTDKAIAGVARSIESLSTQSGKSVPQIASFLTKFVQIEGQAKRDKAAVDFFGASLGTKLIPELEKTGVALAAVSAEGAAAGSSIAGMAGPIGIAVLALAALAAGAVIAAKEIFTLTKNAAEFQGRMFDLAQQTGLAVETLSALEVVARTTGGRLDTIVQAIVLFQRKLDEAQEPLGKTAEQFRKFNIDTSDTETALRSAFTALAAMPEGFAQTNAAAEFFGARGGKQVLAILKETNGDLDATIKRLRELGILISEDAARSADKFNDELALLEFQLRALGAAAAEDLIPALTEVIRNLGGLVSAIRPVVSILSSIGGVALIPARDATRVLTLAVLGLTGQYKELAKAIKEAKDAQNIPVQPVPNVTPVPLPGVPTQQQAAGDAVNQADAVLAEVRRRVAQHNQSLNELFTQGRINREQQADQTIADNKRELQAEQARIDALLSQKELEIKALDEAAKLRGEINNRDTEQYRSITAQVVKLQQERLDKENAFEVSTREIRARAAKERADSSRNQIQNETDLLLSELDRQTKAIEAQIARGATDEDTGITIIEELERAKADARIEGLERQRQIGLLTVQEQKDLNNELQKLQQDRDRLEDEQRERRLERERGAGQRAIDIAIGSIETLIQLEQTAGQRRIDSLNALAAARVITEENAARQILQIRLQLLDDEIEATKSKLEASKSIADRDERVRAQADLNNQIRLLNEQRKSILAAGNRDIEAAQEEDLENQRGYFEELRKLRQETLRAEREVAEEAIRLMIATFARRKDIIRAQRNLELAEEDDRHRRETESIRRQQQEVDEEIRILEKRLARLEIGTTEEIEEHERLIESLERLRLKREELKRQQDLEDERTKTRKRRVTIDADDAEDEADPIGRFEVGIEEISRKLEDTVVPLGEILKSTFLQVADAIGQVVSNYVLLGETGPAVMRKILAQALASIAAEAAVNAIKELALGFATLFFNPAESAAHFTAAGLWASIGVGSALAGRAVAGDLFKSKTAGAGAGGSGGAGQGTGQLNPLDLARNAGPGSQQQVRDQIRPIQVTVHVVPDGTRFGNAVTAHVVEDFNNAGPIREVSLGDGNLNRG